MSKEEIVSFATVCAGQIYVPIAGTRVAGKMGGYEEKKVKNREKKKWRHVLLN